MLERSSNVVGGGVRFSGRGLAWFELSFCFGRDGQGHDPRDQPGDGHVLGNLQMELHGDHGEWGPGLALEEVLEEARL